jgi:RNA polymerase sigma factor (sigma-70 family)
METPVSLLQRLRRDPGPEPWQRLVELYTPLLRGWFRQHGLQAADVDDLVQEVLAAVVRELPKYEPSGRRGAFRTWLRVIARHRLLMFWRTRRNQPGGADLDKLPEPVAELDKLWDREHDRLVAHRLLELIAAEFEPSTVKAFRWLVMEGRAAQEVAAELSMTVNAVYIAKSRVLARLRREAEGLID